MPALLHVLQEMGKLVDVHPMRDEQIANLLVASLTLDLEPAIHQFDQGQAPLLALILVFWVSLSDLLIENHAAFGR